LPPLPVLKKGQKSDEEEESLSNYSNNLIQRGNSVSQFNFSESVSSRRASEINLNSPGSSSPQRVTLGENAEPNIAVASPVTSSPQNSAPITVVVGSALPNSSCALRSQSLNPMPVMDVLAEPSSVRASKPRWW
jgi:hypothetical protein